VTNHCRSKTKLKAALATIFSKLANENVAARPGA